MSGNKVKVSMIRAHKINRHWRTDDFHWKRSMASLSRRLAQNQVAAPLRREENESSYGPSGREYYRGGPARTHEKNQCERYTRQPLRCPCLKTLTSVENS